MHLFYDFFGIDTFQLILIKKFQMILLTNDDFYALQLCFSSFFDWRDPKSTNCKKLDFKTFLEKMRFFAICGFWGCPINKMMKIKVKEHKNRHHLVVSFLKNNE